MCMSVYASVHKDISGNTRAIFTTFLMILCMLPMAVARSSSFRVTKSQGEGALYSIAFETHTKPTEPIEMPFWLMIDLASRNSVLRGGSNPRRGRGNFGGKRVTGKPNPL